MAVFRFADSNCRGEAVAGADTITGTAQPDTAPYNTQCYPFGAVVNHLITIT